MKLLRSLTDSVFRPLLLMVLLGTTCAVNAGPKSLAPGVSSIAQPQNQEPVSRLIIRYHTAVKAAGQGGATAITERLDAAAQVTRSANLSGASHVRYLKSVSPQLRVAVLDQAVSGADVALLIKRLKADPAIAEVVVDRRAMPHSVTNDPYVAGGDQWHLQSSGVVPGGINATPAWNLGTGSGVVVAVLDGGYRPHADLAANVLPGYDFVSADASSRFAGDTFWTANDGGAQDPDAQDPGDWISAADVDAGYCDSYAAGDGFQKSSWHGTHVAGLVAAVGNNAEGGAGVAFGAKVLPVRVLGRCGGYVSDILAGARWAVGLNVPGVPANSTPAKILNLSLGVAGSCASYFQAVVDEVRAQGASIVASSGNDQSTNVSAPANCQGVIGVTAHTREGDNASYANVGAGVRISAPGGGNNSLLATTAGLPRGIVSTGNAGVTTPLTDNYLLFNGTSMAAPIVSGALALLDSVRPGLAMASLEGYLSSTARAFPAGGYCATNPDSLAPGFCGSGLLDVEAASAALSADYPDLLRVRFQSTPSTAAKGQTVGLVISVTNVGTVTASDVTATFRASAGLEIEDGGLPPGATVAWGPTQASAYLAQLDAGQSLNWTVVVRVAADSGVLASTATVKSTVADPYAADDQTTGMIVVLVPASTAPAPSGGGGCTAAPQGQADFGLVILVLVALATLFVRRRRVRR